jgi:hypothetical protein
VAHPSILHVALNASKQIGWTESRQKSNILLALRKSEVASGDSAAAGFRPYDQVGGKGLLEPQPIKDPKNTVAYLGMIVVNLI